MSILDATLARISGAPDTVLDLSKALGMDPAMVEKSVMALAQASVSASNTIELVGSATGLGAGVLNAIAERLDDGVSLREIATIELAAKRTGLGAEALRAVYAGVGGEAALGALADELSAGLRSLGQGDFFGDLLPFG